MAVVERREVSKACVVAVGVNGEGRRELLGASGQRCRVHFMRNVLAYVPRGQHQMVAALIRTAFAQEDQAAARAQVIGHETDEPVRAVLTASG